MPTRRSVILTTAAAALVPPASDAVAAPNAWDFTFPSIDDGRLAFADLRGRVVLVVNTASFCGYTYQYRALEALHAGLSGRGLTVVGVPSQDFNQESASNAEVRGFCEATFGVEFPMAGLSHVRGPEAHPFYRWVRETQGGWEPRWNFHKVLVGRDGWIAGLFSSGQEPDAAPLRPAIESALGA